MGQVRVDLNFLSKNKRILVELLSAAIGKGRFSPVSHADIDWPGVFAEAKKHQVLPLLYPVLSDCGLCSCISGESLEELRNASLFDGKEEESKYFNIRMILSGLYNANIPVIVLKGLVLRELYPHPCLRTMTDVDLLVRPEDMDRAANVLKKMGYRADIDQDKHAAYTHEFFSAIELHRSMEPLGMLENYDCFEEHAWKHAIPVNVSGVQVLSLERTDKMIYLVIHMASHIISSGFGLRQLCDFVLFIEAYKEKVDWCRFYSIIQNLHLENFTNAVFEVCHKLFDLTLPLKCNMKENNSELVANDLMMDIFDAGVFGLDDKDRITANRMLYYSGGSEAKTPGNRLRIFAQLFFPNADKLDVRFGYARRYPILLPAAWIHRFFYNLFRRDIDFTEKTAVFTPAASTVIYSKRSALLKELGLSDKQSGGTL